MPDVSVKIFHGKYPDQSFTDKLKLGDKFLWVPDAELRKHGVNPVLYKVEKYRFRAGRPTTVCMPYYPLPPGVTGG